MNKILVSMASRQSISGIPHSAQLTQQGLGESAERLELCHELYSGGVFLFVQGIQRLAGMLLAEQ